MNSPLWDQMTSIFKLRREMMMSMVMANEDDSLVRVNRLKGRFQEAEYFLTLSEGFREGKAEIRKKLVELDEGEIETQLEEQEGGL